MKKLKLSCLNPALPVSRGSLEPSEFTQAEDFFVNLLNEFFEGKNQVKRPPLDWTLTNAEQVFSTVLCSL